MFFPMIFMEFQVTVNSVVFCTAKKPTTLLTVTTLLRTTLLTVESTVSLCKFSNCPVRRMTPKKLSCQTDFWQNCPVRRTSSWTDLRVRRKLRIRSYRQPLGRPYRHLPIDIFKCRYLQMTFKIKARLGRIFVLNNNAVDLKLFGVLLVLDHMIHGFFILVGITK